MNNSTGAFNTFLGANSGQTNYVGKNNTLIGADSNVNQADLIFATAIGSFAKVSNNDTIVLGKTAGTYNNVDRPADRIIIPGNLTVSGIISGSINGSNLSNINASNITSGTLSDARLSTNIAFLSGTQTFTGFKTFSGGIAGNGSDLTELNASLFGSLFSKSMAN